MDRIFPSRLCGNCHVASYYMMEQGFSINSGDVTHGNAFSQSLFGFLISIEHFFYWAKQC